MTEQLLAPPPAAGAAAPTPPTLLSATLSLRVVRRNALRVQSPPVRSIRRLADAIASGSLDSLPRSSRGCGLCWLAVGLEPETFEAPQLIEVLRKVKEKMVVAEKPSVEAAPATKPVDETKLASVCVDPEKQAEKAEKSDVKVAEVETPSKKRKKLPRLADYLPQVRALLAPPKLVRLRRRWTQRTSEVVLFEEQFKALIADVLFAVLTVEQFMDLITDVLFAA